MEEMLSRIGDFINGMFQSLVNFFADIGHWLNGFYDIIINVASFILGIFGFLWYGIKTLITGIYKLIYYITGTAVWVDVRSAFVYLSHYIGPWGVAFMVSLLLIIIIRIIYAFVHKMIFRPDYSMSRPGKRNWEPTDYVDDETYPRLP